jgi:predicted secreted protein
VFAHEVRLDRAGHIANKGAEMVGRSTARNVSAAVFLGLISSAAADPSIARAQTTITLGGGASEHGTTLTLTQRLDRRVPRDLVQVELRIDLLGADPKQLQTQIAALLDSATKKAKAIPTITVETGAYTVLRQTDARAPRSVPSAMVMSNNGSVVPMTVSSAGDWHAVQLLSLTTSDVATLAPLVSDLENDGLQLSDMRVSLSSEAMRRVQDELETDAVAALRKEAERLATAMDMKIERFVNFNVNASPPENQSAPRPAINFNQQAAQTVVLPSSDFDVWVSVSANVQLAPKANP